ncbi:Dyp-type peroxidase [Catenulispora subtropica]|uniref:Blue (Type 1) copper domain protein n=1 Tax=Catenulispora subtropica TaxID=450798 RepID=A0ABN2QTL3_9ACTN
MILRTTVRRLAAVAALAFAVLGGPAAGAASAHTVGGSGASNYVTTIGPLTPAAPGLTLKVVENGSKLQVENHSGADVVVDGYVGEPYVKVGPDGAFTNTNSPATYLNNDRWAKSPVPAGVDPNAAPVWKKVSDTPVWRWHDHRIHWMSTTPPPAVKSAPDKPHAISTWRITLHRDGQTITADGRLAWQPGPSKALRVTGVILAAAVTLWLCLRGWTLWVALGLVAADVLHSAGVAADIADGPVAAFFKGNVVQLATWAGALWAVWLLARRKESIGALWLAAGAGLLIAAVSGVPDLSVLWSSTAPFAWGVTLAQVLVLVITGVGFGMAVALPVRLRLTRFRHEPASAAAEAPVSSAAEAVETIANAQEAEGAGKLEQEPSPGPSRRSFLATGTTSIGGVAAGAAASALLLDDRRQSSAPAGDLVAGLGTATVAVPLPHQAGISVPARQQGHGTVAAFDLVDGATREQLKALMKAWTAVIADLTAGRAPSAATGTGTGTGTDDAIALGSGPCSLTVTVGFGPSLFGKAGLDPAARPPQLAPLPVFGTEQLDAARSDGDLGVVLAADDALVVFHALRTLTRIADGTAKPRWTMSGFTRAPGSSPDPASTGRNLMGQLDGTNNPTPAQPDFDRKVFVPGDADTVWMRGGSYLVFRRIRMLLDSWEAQSTAEQEKVIGRRKDSGAPLHGGTEHTKVNLAAQNPDGTLAIRGDAHIRLAAPETNGGAAMLRRGMSYNDGLTGDGKPDAGLLFLAWQADPASGFIPVQQRLTKNMDALNRFTKHETSALFAMVPAATGGGYLGQALLEPGAASGASGASGASASSTPAAALPTDVGSGGSGRAVLGPDGVQRITVTADDSLRYHPSVIEMAPGTIEVTFKNAGTLPHTLSEDGPPLPGEPVAGVPQLAGGDQTTMSLKLTQPGDYPFQCGYHAAEGMYAVIRVR